MSTHQKKNEIGSERIKFF